MLPDEADDPRFDEYGFRVKLQPARSGIFKSKGATETSGVTRWQRRSTPRQLSRRPIELKRLVRQGIPPMRRADVWLFLLRAETLRCVEPDEYYEFLRDHPSGIGRADAAEHRTSRQIDLDVSRTFPSHKVFGTSAGRGKLRSVLLAYARRNPAVGYVQGMGFLAAVLLLFLDEEAAFWCLCAIVERLLPESFFSPSLLGLRAELATFGALVSEKLPRLSRHLNEHGVVPELYATRWFIAGFATSLPMGTVLRIWDSFFFEGIKVFHRIGLALLKICEARLLNCGEQHHLLCVLQEEEAHCYDCGRLFALAFDTRSFIGPFPRARLVTLRAQYFIKLSGDTVERSTIPTSATASWERSAQDVEAQDDDGRIHLTLAPPDHDTSHPESEDEDQKSSCGESSDEEQHIETISSDAFEMISVDDVAGP